MNKIFKNIVRSINIFNTTTENKINVYFNNDNNLVAERGDINLIFVKSGEDVICYSNDDEYFVDKERSLFIGLLIFFHIDFKEATEYMHAFKEKVGYTHYYSYN